MKLCQALNQLVRCPGLESSTSETVQTLAGFCNGEMRTAPGTASR